MEVRGVGVVVDGDTAAGRATHGDLFPDVIGPPGLVVGTDHMEPEGATALAVHDGVDVLAAPTLALERPHLDPHGTDDPHEEEPEERDDAELEHAQDRSAVDGDGGCRREEVDQGRVPGLTRSRNGARWFR